MGKDLNSLKMRLKELDERLTWPKYQGAHGDFCYGIGFEKHENCQFEPGQMTCPEYDICRQESEADWPEK